MQYLYSFLLALVAPFLIWRLHRPAKDKPRVGRRWKEHFGLVPPIGAEKPIWIHAVSVGEVIAAKALIVQLQQRDPNAPILVTTTTPTGAAMVESIGHGIFHRYMPFDFSFAVKCFLKRIQPRILLIMETELWPNTLHAAYQANVPIVVVNARLSERSKNRYQKFQRVFTWLSRPIQHISCQFQEDAERFEALGIHKSRLSVSGSMKFDLPEFDTSVSGVRDLKTMIDHRPTWIAASTHEGEDEILLLAHRKIVTAFPDAILILVPRHPERFQSVAALIQRQGFQLAQRSRSEAIVTGTGVYLGDTLGEMMTLFSGADVAFMAGSLLGDSVGGHNLLEPSSLAKPLLTGPSFYNFQRIAEALIQAGACEICDSPDAIAKAVMRLFSSPDEREARGVAALRVVHENRGAVEKTIQQIAPWLE